MKAITISQPWASLIASGEKWVENRTWATNYRGLLAIHAGKGTQCLGRDELASYPTGCIVSVARLTACVKIEDVRSGTTLFGFPGGCGKTYAAIGEHQYSQGPFCWVLEDVVKLDVPIPCVGKQGLWDSPVVLGMNG